MMASKKYVKVTHRLFIIPLTPILFLKHKSYVGIKHNSTIKKLNLASNHFGEAGAKYLCEALSLNKAIRTLDMSRNALGYSSINSLLCVCGPRNVNVSTFGNYVSALDLK